MATFKAIIIPGGDKKDGTYPVKIRVTHQGKSRRLPTNISCKKSDLNGKGQIKSRNILNATEPIIQKMYDIMAQAPQFELEHRDVDWVVQYVKIRLQSNVFQLDFFEYARNLIKNKKEGTRKAYNVALNSFSRFLGKDTIDINIISRTMVLEYVRYLNENPREVHVISEGVIKKTSTPRVKNACASNYVGKLAAIFKAAKQEFNDDDNCLIRIPRSPFNIEIERVIHNGQRSLKENTIQMMIDEKSCTESIRFALDMFLISFALMGMNLADIYEVKRCDNKTLRYNRKKTRDRRLDRAEMRIDIPREIVPILERHQNTDNGYWLSDLIARCGDCGNADKAINRSLSAWATEHGLEPFTFYAARHTFATLCRKAGADKGLVDECLAHVGDFNLVDIYAERNWENINAANKRVVAMFNWPKK